MMPEFWFLDEDEKVIERVGFADAEVAERYAEGLAKRTGKAITVLELYTVVGGKHEG